jgi:hypothetical protein
MNAIWKNTNNLLRFWLHISKDWSNKYTNLNIIKLYVIIVIVKIVTEEERTKCLKAFKGRPLGK